MNPNPAFYPKHLARQFVQMWSDGSDKSQQVAPASYVTNINGQRSVTPVGGSGGRIGFKSTEGSPSSMTSSPLDSANSSRSSHESNRKILEGLPDTFITAMKQLFTLLDIENSGYVHIEDIAENWSTEGAGAILPPNIVPSLRKVTTPEGYLTFERFCAGLKIAILRHSAQRHRQADTDSSEGSIQDHSDQSGSGEALASSPLSRTSSMPNLPDIAVAPPLKAHQEQKAASPVPSEPFYPGKPSQGPPKPPRDPSRLSSVNLMRDVAGSTSSLPAAIKNGKNEPEFIWKAPPCRPFAPPFVSRSGKMGYNEKRHHSISSIRRHTLQGGVHYDKVNTMESLGQSKKTLEEGIQWIEHVDQWYKTQLDAVEDQLLIVEQIDENSDQGINFNANGVHDLNHRMSQLLSGSCLEDYRSNEMNANYELQRRIERLQEQNRMLTTEISRQSNRVTALEQDKRSLIKQLFQQSSAHSSISSNASSTLR